MSEPVLSVENLQTHFLTKGGTLKAVDGVSFRIHRGEIMGLVGESGSGKTVTGFSILRLVDAPGRIVGGRIMFQGENLLDLSEERMRETRGSRLSMIFQDPMMSLNPVLRIDTQIMDAIRAHEDINRAAAFERARDALAMVGIPSPGERLLCYPHQFSGGMRQRVAIAIALLHKPELIIADEPTTALDVTIQAQILSEVQKLCRETGTALMWITHDLAVVSALADTICVMYAGKIVESGNVEDVIGAPMHPYTKGLIGSVPSDTARGHELTQIPGMAPSLANLPAGCTFRPRCERANERCKQVPELESPDGERRVRCFHPYVEAPA